MSCSAIAVALMFVLAGCGNDIDGSSPTVRAAAANPNVNSPPTLAGSPVTTAAIGSSYRFAPVAADADGDTLSFAVQNLPKWASFSASTGALSGTPQTGDAGNYPNVVISVSDGHHTAALPAFTIAVLAGNGGSATLSWVAPTQNDDGTPLLGLSGYVVLYGMNANSLDHTATISDPVATSYVVPNLQPGTWYFGLAAVAVSGAQSRTSDLVSKTIG